MHDNDSRSLRMRSEQTRTSIKRINLRTIWHVNTTNFDYDENIFIDLSNEFVQWILSNQKSWFILTITKDKFVRI